MFTLYVAAVASGGSHCGLPSSPVWVGGVLSVRFVRWLLCVFGGLKQRACAQSLLCVRRCLTECFCFRSFIVTFTFCNSFKQGSQ